jgi:hypothetical protein
VKKQYGPGSGATQWGKLAQQRIETLSGVDAIKKDLEKLLDTMQRTGQEPAPPKEREAAETLEAARYEQLGDKSKAWEQFDVLKKRWEEDIKREPEKRFWYLLASLKAWELRDAKDKKTESNKLIEEKLAQAEEVLAKPGTPLAGVRADCLNIVALYSRETKLEPLVKRARDLLKRMEGPEKPK